MIYDVDGSLSSTFFNGSTVKPNSTIMPYMAHNEIPGACVNNSDDAKWNTSIICDNTTIFRGVTFTNALPDAVFATTNMKWYRLSSATQNISALTDPYETQWMIKAMLDKKKAWSGPFAMGKYYNAWWNLGLDWTHVALAPSLYFKAEDPGVIFRFNYTETRELFENTRMLGGVLEYPFISPKATLAELDFNTCASGDYFQDTASQYLYVCVSGKETYPSTYIDLNGIKCRYLCPEPEGEFTKEPFIRLWSNATQWPNGVMPVAGDNVTVNGNWTIIMDVDPAPIKVLQIDGDVIISDRNTAITAEYIWIRAGSLNAGNASSPFNSSVTITLNGLRNSTSLVIDEMLAGNKFMVVTGALNLYGQTPGTVWTRLTAKAAAGAQSITVASASGWAVGDELGIAPSFRNTT